jgi:prophage antirepressor-like protein
VWQSLWVSDRVLTSHSDQFSAESLGFLCMAIHDRFGQLQVATVGGLQAAAPVPQIAGPAVPDTGYPEFAFKGHRVRVEVVNNEPWFWVRDVCLALGSYLGIRSRVPNVTQAIKVMNPDEAHLSPIKMSINGATTTRKVMLTSESSLYKLIMRSDKPEAKAFRDWMTREILPSIRKTGSYSVQGQQAAPHLGGHNNGTPKLLAFSLATMAVVQSPNLVSGLGVLDNADTFDPCTAKRFVYFNKCRIG